MLSHQTGFITGGVGSIGARIAGKVLDKNKVVVYDNLTRNSWIDRLFLNHPNLALNIQFSFQNLYKILDPSTPWTI